MKCNIFFSPYVLLLPNSVLARLIIWIYTNIFFTLTVALWIVFFPQKFCVVYLNVSGYQIKAWNIDLIYIWMTKN